MSRSVIAIDGPSYVGKSTISRCLAELMGYTYVNTGHMYRAVAKLSLEEGIPVSNREALAHLAEALEIQFETRPGACRTWINGKDWTRALDDYDVVLLASQVARLPDVRAVLTEKQRRYTQDQRIVMEGRDIGSVVFPDATWKFFVTASLDVRARRMYKMMDEASRQSCPDYRELIPKVQELDEADVNRETAPLRKAEDAIVYDNSDSPSEMEDALILQYHITHAAEILKNARILEAKWMEIPDGKHS